MLKANEDRALMTVTVFREERKMLRIFAAELDTSISCIIREWIESHRDSISALYKKSRR